MALHDPVAGTKGARETGDFARGAVVVHQREVGLRDRQHALGLETAAAAALAEHPLAAIEEDVKAWVAAVEQGLQRLPPEGLHILRLVADEHVVAQFGGLQRVHQLFRRLVLDPVLAFARVIRGRLQQVHAEFTAELCVGFDIDVGADLAPQVDVQQLARRCRENSARATARSASCRCPPRPRRRAAPKRR